MPPRKKRTSRKSGDGAKQDSPKKAASEPVEDAVPPAQDEAPPVAKKAKKSPAKGKGAGKGKAGSKTAKAPEQAPAPAPSAEPAPPSAESSVSKAAQDPLMDLAYRHWLGTEEGSVPQGFDASVVEKIYTEELFPAKGKHAGGGGRQTRERLQLLEFSAYLEQYLWPHFDAATATSRHIMSIILMLNEKFREGVTAWEHLRADKSAAEDVTQGKFQAFFLRVVELQVEPSLWGALSAKERCAYTLFLINVYASCFEEPMVSGVAMRLVSLPLWERLTPGRLRLELSEFPQLLRHWQHLQARKKGKEGGKGGKGAANGGGLQNMEAAFLPAVVEAFLSAVEAVPGDLGTAVPRETMLYCERCLELLVDLMAQLHTRRFLRTMLDDMHVLERCELSALATKRSAGDGKLFSQLLELFRFYLGFEISDQTGEALSDAKMQSRHLQRIHVLQRLAFKYHQAAMKDFSFLSASQVGQRNQLQKLLGALPDPVLLDLCCRSRLLQQPGDGGATPERDLMLRVLVNSYAERESQVDKISQMPLYPDEQLLFDPNSVPLGSYHGDRPLALPKLNLQFLTFQDYLLRAFNLFRLESAYEIREDLMDAIRRLAPRTDPFGKSFFGGWARMAAQVGGFSVTEVAKPKLGERVPAKVTAEVKVSLAAFDGLIREEWEALREHDVVFLVSLAPPHHPPGTAGAARVPPPPPGPPPGGVRGGGRKGGRGKRDVVGAADQEDLDFMERYGIRAVRGCEVYEFVDEDGVLLNEPMKPDARKGGRAGDNRILRVRLDPAQYHADMKGGNDAYGSFNVLVRRKAKENNFRSVLETIRDLMSTAAVGKAVPPWLHDIFLGYGDPSAAHYRQLQRKEELAEDAAPQPASDFRDTFLDAAHVREAFPEAAEFVFAMDGKPAATPPPPYRLRFERVPEPGGGKGGDRERVVVDSYVAPNPGPYPVDQPKKNGVRFTSVQTEAIRSGMSKGLTMVVGPPGTGKTDVAVQIIANLYHNFPNQKTLIVTHSNSALNDLFQKIMERDVQERHLLRLGAGVEALAEFTGGQDYSKFGRVNHTLSRRQALLDEVQRLASSLGIHSDVGYTCEAAEFFDLYHVQSRIEKFEADVSAARARGSTEPCVAELFPFQTFFSDADPSKMFQSQDDDADLEVARGCFRHMAKVFEELRDFRAFELLRNHRMRSNYLLLKQARIVAMTCTHAAITRRQLVDLGFRYDNLVMEEAAQILEVETVIPMLLQDLDAVEGCRLKRVCLIGDHHQLPPVVKNMALQKYGKLDQTLFTRFVRLGVPHVLLNQQGRARPDIAKLYSWRYEGLGNLPAVMDQDPAYQSANAGFSHTFQLVNVPDFRGRGESSPTPHFYQNLGEAEYVVAVYQYMRLLGYPAEKISILTTYNGQKHLIRDVLAQRCANPIFGQPLKVTTVDKYQGQQNDYILLSLVRTNTVGHLRDVRRLVVALSRARLGLYVFCRQSLFEPCYELAPAFGQLVTPERPSKLQLVLGERWPCERKADDNPPADAVLTLEDSIAVTQLGAMVHQMAQMHLVGASAVAAPETPAGADMEEG